MVNDVLDLVLQIAAEVVVVEIISAQRVGQLRRLPENKWTGVDA